MISVYVKPWTKADGSWEVLLREILKRDYGLENVVIGRDGFGKPYLENEELFFNVSHAGAYVVFAVSEAAVGVDIEGRRKIKDGMYRKVVQPEEQELIGEDREWDFLRLWTLKESFVKAEGKGLRIPMREYYFRKEDEGFQVYYGGARASWRFYLLEEVFAEGYVISVCGQEKEIRWTAETGDRQCSMRQGIS